VPPPATLDKAFPKLKRQTLFQKQTLKLRPDKTLYLTLRRRDLEITVVVEKTHIDCKVAVETLAEVEHLLPWEALQHFGRMYIGVGHANRRCPVDALKL